VAWAFVSCVHPTIISAKHHKIRTTFYIYAAQLLMQTQGTEYYYLVNKNWHMGPNPEEHLATYKLHSAMIYMVGLAPGLC